MAARKPNRVRSDPNEFPSTPELIRYKPVYLETRCDCCERPIARCQLIRYSSVSLRHTERQTNACFALWPIHFVHLNLALIVYSVGRVVLVSTIMYTAIYPAYFFKIWYFFLHPYYDFLTNYDFFRFWTRYIFVLLGNFSFSLSIKIACILKNIR